jgi:hypothetical protein
MISLKEKKYLAKIIATTCHFNKVKFESKNNKVDVLEKHVIMFKEGT